MVEFSCHGGALAPAETLAALILGGARHALPGEFTQRAFLHGKIDLLQAEAIATLIDAATASEHSNALRQLDGSLSRAVGELRGDFLELEALLAYDIDFPEEDDGPISTAAVAAAAAKCLQALDRLLATAELGRISHSGATVVLAGAPNAGKSSLFNALLGERRALVTDIPGTTRDVLDAALETGRVPLRLVDTAGLRDSQDALELLGIEAALTELERADVVLVCGASTAETRESLQRINGRGGAVRIRVLTKSDISAEAAPDVDIAVSALTRSGLDELVSLVGRKVAERHGEIATDVPILTRARHKHALSAARAELLAFKESRDYNLVPALIASSHLRTAVHYLDELIGSVDVDDILATVFSKFCVGK